MTAESDFVCVLEWVFYTGVDMSQHKACALFWNGLQQFFGEYSNIETQGQVNEASGTQTQ